MSVIQMILAAGAGTTAAPAPPPVDPLIANVVFLANYNSGTGADIGSAETVSNASVWNAGSGRFGGGISNTGAQSYRRYAATPNFQFTANFAIDFWYKPSSLSGNQHLFDIGSNGFALQTKVTTINMVVSGGVVGSAAHNITAGQWNYCEISRVGNQLRLFTNGTLLSTTTNSAILGNNVVLTIGNYGGSNNASAGTNVFDCFRITKGAGRNTANYTVPAYEPSTT